MMLFLFVAIAGRVHGIELCPADFSTRTFTYYELPIFKKQLTRVTHSDEFSSMSDFLITNNYLASAKAPKTWHLVGDNRTAPDSEFCDARILVDYLNQIGPNYGFVWAAWSDEHNLHAQVLWPLVSQLAEDRLYVDIPKILEFSRRPATIEDFKSRLNEMAADIYLHRGKELQQLDEHDRAIEYFQRAITHGSDKQETDKLIKASSSELDELAASDEGSSTE